MSFGHLAAAVFLLTLRVTAAPQDLLSHIAIRVVDTSGVRINSAAIGVVSSAGPVDRIHTDSSGEALIDLPCGTYYVTVTSRGFQRKTETVNITDHDRQVLDISLAANPGPALRGDDMGWGEYIPVEHAAPLVQLPSTQVQLKVMVKDQSGAFIPQATIEFRSSGSATTTKVESDARGDAILHLDPGSYSISITSRGFATWSSHVDVQWNGQSISAELKIGGGGGVQLMPMDLGLETERQIFDASIALEPLQSLINLPGRKLPHHARIRHRAS